MELHRRGFLRVLGQATGALFFTSCGIRASGSPDTQAKDDAPLRPQVDSSGYLSIVQGPTRETETLINLFVPRRKKYSYSVQGEGSPRLEVYERVEGPGFFHAEKLKVDGLRPGVIYTLDVKDGESVVDSRTFSSLDTEKPAKFAFMSCMSDDRRFNASIDPMWEKARREDPDFLLLDGDLVYVDTFEFVDRDKATESDIWQRYVDSLRRLPLYHWSHLKPVFAVWDDHDFGTNDGNRNFAAKEASAKVFRAIFSGQDLPGFWEKCPSGVSSTFVVGGQRFFLMDDRTFRQPNKNQLEKEPFGHWGETAHDWLLRHLEADPRPAWIVNGNQCFNGAPLDFKESFEGNHPLEFESLLASLRRHPHPVLFASGDVHLSEIMRIPPERLGYETFELTSSSMHSFGGGEGWPNPLRMEGTFTSQHNFFLIKSRRVEGGVGINVKCLGMGEAPYFERSLSVRA